MIIGIVADDLTGAADSVAPFAARGLNAGVQWVSDGRLSADLEDSAARAWSTGTRDMPADRQFKVRRLTRAVTRGLRRFSPKLYFKKIDSTLRGHLRAELDAMRTELPGRLAIVCPAFPVHGRTVSEGVLHVHGEPRQNVRAAFRMEGDPLAIELHLETLRSLDAESWPGKEWLTRGVHTVFCDAESPGDLDFLAETILQSGERILPVGSAGLSTAIAGRIATAMPDVPDDRALREALMRDPVLVLVGSMHAATRRQAAALARAARVSPVTVRDSQDCAFAGREIARRFAASERVVLVKTPDEENEAFNSALASIVYQEQLEWNGGFGLVMTGGHTAAHVVERVREWSGIAIVGEMEPGIVLGRIQAWGRFGSAMAGRPVVLKAGAFGDDGALARCVGL